MTTAITSALDLALTHAARWRRAFDARARRERMLVIVAVLALACALVNLLWLDPALKRWSAAHVRRGTAIAAVRQLDQELARRAGAELQVRSDVAAWHERVAQDNQALRELRATLVSASEMVPMLDRLLTQVGGLRLRSLRSQERTEIRTAGAVASAAEPPVAGTLYRHGVDLSVEGSYADVLAYLRAVEAMPQRVLWDGMQLQVERHPKVVMTLRLYTLSDDDSWLEI